MSGSKPWVAGSPLDDEDIPNEDEIVTVETPSIVAAFKPEDISAPRWRALAETFNEALKEHYANNPAILLDVRPLQVSLTCATDAGYRKRPFYRGDKFILGFARPKRRGGLLLQVNIDSPTEKHLQDGVQYAELSLEDMDRVFGRVWTAVYEDIMGMSVAESLERLGGGKPSKPTPEAPAGPPVRAIELLPDWGDWAD